MSPRRRTFVMRKFTRRRTLVSPLDTEFSSSFPPDAVPSSPLAPHLCCPFANLLVPPIVIHKYLGASTPDGLEWQFRKARKTGQEMRAAVAAGGTYTTTASPAGTTAPAPAPTTTRKRAPAASKRAPAQSTAASRKRGKQVMMDEDEDEDDDDDPVYKERKTRARPSSRGGRPVTAAVTPTTTVRPPPAPPVATRRYPLYAEGWSPDSRRRPVSRQTSLADTRDEVVRDAQGGQPSYLTSAQRAQRERDAQVALQSAPSFQQPRPQPRQYPQGSAMQSFNYQPRQEQRVQQQTQPQTQQQQNQNAHQHHHQPFHHHHNHHQSSYSPSTFASHSLSPTTPHDDFPSFVDPLLQGPSTVIQHQQHQGQQQYHGSYTEQLFADDDEAEKDGEI